MALDKPYKDVPGTIIFDAEQSRKGYWLNQFCMSLMKAENREKFKADQRAYLDQWPMTEEQKQAAMDSVLFCFGRMDEELAKRALSFGVSALREAARQIPRARWFT